MSLLKKWLVISGTLFICFVGSITGQTGYQLNFQGLLADIEGHAIIEDTFRLTIHLRGINDSENLFEHDSIVATDKEGWFAFTIDHVTKYMMSEDGTWKPILLQLEFNPDTHTEWLDQGSDFLVTYTLEPSKSAGALFQMTRMEGSSLEVYSETHLHAFRDLYPFAYLTGGFLITDQPPIDSLSVADLRQWLTPGELDEEDTSRGIKGGFPVGGYRKKK